MSALPTQIVNLRDANAAMDFDLRPTPDEAQAIATALGFLSAKKARFQGHIRPQGDSDWALSGHLGATIVQPCSVTLDPVTTRVDTPVTRTFLADFKFPDETGEYEMPEDETVEAIPDDLDLFQVLAEALSLAAPDFPRSQAAKLEESSFAPPGVAPLSDEDTKPFAGLKALKDKLDGNGRD